MGRGRAQVSGQSPGCSCQPYTVLMDETWKSQKKVKKGVAAGLGAAVLTPPLLILTPGSLDWARKFLP